MGAEIAATLDADDDASWRALPMEERVRRLSAHCEALLRLRQAAEPAPAVPILDDETRAWARVYAHLQSLLTRHVDG
jgi:hypothetical protein